MDFLNAQFWKDKLRGAVVALFLLGALVPGAHAQLGLIPSINVQPLDQSVKKGGTAVFTVEASSLTTMSYQWYRNSNAIAGATGQTYTRANLDFADAGFYHVVVANLIGSTKSDVVTLIVVTNTAPVGLADTFSTPEDIRLTVPAPGVLTNDTDADGDALTAALVSNVVNGTLSFNANGGFVYTPNTNFFGSDSFTYYTKDGDTVILEENASGGTKQEIANGTGAQSFRHGTIGESAYSIKKVLLRLSKKSDQVLNLNFSIGTGRNSGPIAGSSYTITMASISNNTEGVSFQNYEIVYSTPVGPLTAGATYYLNLENASSGGKRVYVELASGDTYANGTFYGNGSDQLKDMVFKLQEEVISSLTTVTLNITAVNDAPQAVNDSTSTLEDTSVAINVLANDSDVEGAALSVTGASTTNGTAVISGNDIVFTPSTNFYGTVVFSYTVSDGFVSGTGLVTVVVAPVNDAPPVAVDDAYTVTEDATLTIAAAGILINDTDVDGDAKTAVLVSNVSHGTLTFNANGSFTYRPNTNFFGSDSFTYHASDGAATGNVATVTLTVTPVNDAPRAFNDSTNTLEDTSVTIKVLANDTDVEGTALTISGTTTTNGTAVVSGTNVVFTPSTNFYGTAVFSYTISDGSLSATGSVTVTVAPVNDAPRAVNDSTNTTEDTSVTVKVLLNDSDVEGSALTISSATTTNGTAVISGTNIVFTPSTNFNGTTVFSYVISDGSLSATGNVTVTVTAVNDAPIAVNDSTNTLEDVSVAVRVLANDFDVEGTALTLISASTTNGTATVSGTNVTFRAATNFYGTVVFSYVVSDGNKSSTGSVTVAVASVNDAPPVAVDNSYTTAEDVPRTVTGTGVLGNDTDVDGDPMTAILVSSVSNGTLSFTSNGRFTYTPNTNFYGTDSFTYCASDGMATGNVATVTITVTPVNDAPVVNNDSATVMEDTWIAINVLTNDIDPEGTLLNFTAITGTNGSYATTATNRNVILFLPSTNYNGVVAFSYTVSDGTNSATANVTVTVTPTYDAPVAINDSTNTPEDVSVTIKVLANDYNPDGSALTITNAWTTNGTSIISGTNVIFTPLTNFNGTGFVFYAVSDGFNTSTGTVTVTVTPVNDAPVATDDSYVMLEDALLTIPAAGILTNDYDVDGDPLTALLITDVSNGTLILNTNGSFTYRPATNFNGSDSFAYVPLDGKTFGNLAIVTINITAVNDAPIAANDTATVAEDGSVSVKVLLNDSDPEGSPLTITRATSTNGTVVVSGTNVVFTPPPNFNGTSVFSYTISDGVYSATGAVTVTVTAVNDAPVANADSATTLEDVSVTINVLENDTDTEKTPLSLTSATTTNGTAVISGTNIVFTPATNFNGTAVFTYRATDGNKFATGTVTVVVTPVNDGPVANTNTYTTPEDVPLIVPAPGILADDLDIEGDSFTAVLVSDVSNGSLSLNPDGSFIYTPNPDFNGTDSFTYRGTDGLALGNIVTVTLNVTPVVDVLRFVSQKRVTNGMRLELSGPNACPYVVEASSNLIDWMAISTNFAAFGNVVVTDPRATNLNQPTCYYRAMIPASTNLQQNATGGTRVEIDPALPGAQSFRHGSAGGSNYGISKVVIRISRDSPTPNGNLIFSVGTGINSGAFAGSTFAISPESVTNNSAGTTFQRYEIVFPEPIGPLMAGTTYYLNFAGQSSNGQNYWLERSSGASTYPRGTFYSGGADISRDMRFEIWGQ